MRYYDWDITIDWTNGPFSNTWDSLIDGTLVHVIYLFVFYRCVDMYKHASYNWWKLKYV